MRSDDEHDMAWADLPKVTIADEMDWFFCLMRISAAMHGRNAKILAVRDAVEKAREMGCASGMSTADVEAGIASRFRGHRRFEFSDGIVRRVA